MSRVHIQPFFHAGSNTFSYVVHELASGQAVVIDPVMDFDLAAACTNQNHAQQIVDWVLSQQLQVIYILDTHVHADHLTAAPFIQQHCGGKTAIGSRIVEVQQQFAAVFGTGAEFNVDGRQFDLLLADNSSLPLGQLQIHVMHTPGHTPACVSYLLDDSVFVGDTLFMPDYGTARCDFPGGDAAMLYQSIQRLFTLPARTRVFLCHDYGAAQRPAIQHQTSIAAQIAENIHVGAGRTLEEFVLMRQQRDATLSMPQLLLPAVQVNMRAGHWPEPEQNGVSYLKLPINLFKKATS